MTTIVTEYELVAKCVVCDHRWYMSQADLNRAAEMDCAVCPKCSGGAVVEKANLIFKLVEE